MSFSSHLASMSLMVWRSCSSLPSIWMWPVSLAPPPPCVKCQLNTSETLRPAWNKNHRKFCSLLTAQWLAELGKQKSVKPLNYKVSLPLSPNQPHTVYILYNKTWVNTNIMLCTHTEELILCNHVQVLITGHWQNVSISMKLQTMYPA